MKHVKLLTTARVHGALRSPAEGVLRVSPAEADRLVAAKVAHHVAPDGGKPATPGRARKSGTKPKTPPAPAVASPANAKAAAPEPSKEG